MRFLATNRARLATLVLALALPSSARAAVVCYDESRYPSVPQLVRTEAGFQVPGKALGSGAGFPVRRSAAAYSESRGWERVENTCTDWKDCYGSEEQNGFPGPAIELSGAEAIRLRPSLAQYWSSSDGYMPPDEIEQAIGAWTQHDGAYWFGISFYDGEGTSGVGGVGRFDPETGKMEVRRPAVLRDSSVFSIAHDGRSLWVSTDAYHECLGNRTPHGLVRYDWDADRFESFEGRDDGPCGFTVHDLLVDAKYLWVANDLGLSRRDRGTGTWEHFVPDFEADPPMRPTSCDALYQKLLGSLPRQEDESAGISFYSQLFASLEKFRPRFLAGYVSSLPPDKWGCEEMGFLGAAAPDVAALEKSVLAFHSLEASECALQAFGEKKVRDPAWRDLLLKLLESPKQHFGILYLLQHFAPDAKIGDVLVRRLSSADNPWHEAELLPSMIGEKSVPVLIAALARYRQEPDKTHIVESIVSGLMAATRTVIRPDGTETKLAPGASPDVCLYDCPPKDATILQVADHWNAWWRVHERDHEGEGATPEPDSASD